MQEELEVRLEESSLPAPDWVEYDKSGDNSQSADDEQKSKSTPYTGGHVKLELEGNAWDIEYNLRRIW